MKVEYSDAAFDELRSLVANGIIVNATREDLIRYSVMLASPKGAGSFSAEYSAVVAAINNLSSLRSAEAIEKSNFRLSLIALVVAVAGLLSPLVFQNR